LRNQEVEIFCEILRNILGLLIFFTQYMAMFCSVEYADC